MGIAANSSRIASLAVDDEAGVRRLLEFSVVWLIEGSKGLNLKDRRDYPEF
jgi:hypothetical protein